MTLLDVLKDLVVEEEQYTSNGKDVIKDHPQRYCKGKGCLIGKINMTLAEVAQTDTERYMLAATIFRQFPLNSTKELTVAQGVALWKMRNHIVDLALEVGWRIKTPTVK